MNRRVVFTAVALLVAANSAQAQTSTWNAAGRNWFDSDNWTPDTVPTNARDAVINNSGTGTLTLDGGILRANVDNMDYLSNFGAGGVTFRTNGFDITVGARLNGGTGTGGLTKLGDGTLTLTANNNSYTGTTTISGGASLGRALAIGSTAVGGNPTFDAGSRLLIRYESPTVVDSFNVAGVTTINPGSTFELVVPGPYTAPAQGQIITVVNSTGGVVGQFDNIVLPAVAATDFTVQTTAATVDLVGINIPAPAPAPPVIVIVATPVPFSEFAATYNEAQVANNLDVVRLSNPEGRMRTMGPLLAGTNYDSGAQFTDPTLDAKRMAVDDKKMISVLDIDNKAFEAAPDNRWGAFATGTGQFGDVNGGNNLGGYDFTSDGVTLGIDYRVADNAAIGFAGSNATVDSLGSTVGADSARFGLYGT